MRTESLSSSKAKEPYTYVTQHILGRVPDFQSVDILLVRYLGYHAFFVALALGFMVTTSNLEKSAATGQYLAFYILRMLKEAGRGRKSLPPSSTSADKQQFGAYARGDAPE
ncbi:hypothetical protein P691DRAFT_778662 [Macrolepiota fuliginosa MF-IS2]|uniref:Uncharacterized protein n=1 Tax=Macrolepiota fuliginosa MF-IS2 TaxID=1400762 RepID=A0A9P5X3N4_9AGAR|nr:hypothetical protein P691DRAFT_778662 [Macrolepiota fuliginosa MF-IS2]